MFFFGKTITIADKGANTPSMLNCDFCQYSVSYLLKWNKIKKNIAKTITWVRIRFSFSLNLFVLLTAIWKIIVVIFYCKLCVRINEQVCKYLCIQSISFVFRWCIGVYFPVLFKWNNNSALNEQDLVISNKYNYRHSHKNWLKNHHLPMS